ncbi:hypothetical protein JW979_16380 [bacterium]|nr:hypothetical protein [candidate division CSSED10-310 bacterium]
MKKVITPVGLSVFTNFFEKYPRSTLRDDFREFESVREYPASKYKRYKTDLSELQKAVLEFTLTNEDAAAEITSLLKIREQFSDDESLDVYLLATDSILSPLSAEIIKARFDKISDLGISVRFEFDYDVMKGLNAESKEDFQNEGLQNFINRFHEIAANNYTNVILNITGGYKGLIPYLSIIGQIEYIPLMYIFENSTELIEIPRLPVDFDFSIIEDNYIAFENFRKSPQNWPSPEEFKKDLDTDIKEAEEEFKRLLDEYQLIKVIDGKVHLTTLGWMLRDKYDQLIAPDPENRLDRDKLIAKLIELKVYEYYAVELGKTATVKLGESVGQPEFDIDVYIEEIGGTINAIEIKAGNNPPILMREHDSHKKKKETIEHKIIKGGFDHLRQTRREAQLNFMVVLYHHKDIHPRNRENIEQLHQKYPEQTKNLGWYWLRLPPKYKVNVNWEVKNHLVYLYGKQLSIGGKYV